MDRATKQQVVTEMQDAINASQTVIIAHYKGLTVAEVTELRKEMRNASAGFKVTKNSLVKLAIKGTKFENLSDLFVGPTAIAFSEDAVAAAKVAVKFAEDNDNFNIIGGALDSQELDMAAIKSLAAMPSLDELRAKLVSLIQTPATRIAGVVQAPAGQIARLLAAKQE